MTQQARVYTAIDVGTTKVCTIVGTRTGAKGFRILTHSVVPSEGLKKGNVEDVAATEKAIRASIEVARQSTGINIQSAWVGVAGAHVSFSNRQDTMDWAASRGVITAQDLTHVPQRVASTSVESGRKVLHAMPMSFSLDGQPGIRNPVGMHTRNLAVETHVVTGASSQMDKLVAAVENAGVTLEALVLEPLASSEAVLTQQEKNQGVIFVDIGGGTTDVVVFSRGRICYTAVIPVGGYQFTNDICVTYNTLYPDAEAAKLKYAHVELSSVPTDEEVSLPVVGRTTELKVPRRDICQLTRERAQELIRLIKLKLGEASIEETSKVGLVLTGGSANLPGLPELMQQKLRNRVRIGVPNGNGDVPIELKAPAFATGVGILLWATAQRESAAVQAKNGSGPRVAAVRNRVVSRFFKVVRVLWPRDLFSAKQGRTQ